MAQQANQEVFISAEFLRDASPKELKALISETQQKLLDVKTDKAHCFGYAQRPHLFKAYRKLIARAKTILKEQGYSYG